MSTVILMNMENKMKVSDEVRKTIEDLFEKAYANPKSTMLERTIIYAVSLVIFSYMMDEE